MMKLRSGSIIVVLFAVFFISTLSVHADLYNRGTDINGNRLIYDSGFNITWYDYTRTYSGWLDQMNWAADLTVNFGGTVYDDWRLPSTVDGVYVEGYNGTTTGGWNITSSEMGHLFYAELGNTGKYDTSGNLTGCDSNPPSYCLVNTGYFQNLQPRGYWSGTEYAADISDLQAWRFGFQFGGQTTDWLETGGNYAIAVRSGDVPQQPIVPEPISSILFITGGAVFAVQRVIKRMKTK